MRRCLITWMLCCGSSSAFLFSGRAPLAESGEQTGASPPQFVLSARLKFHLETWVISYICNGCFFCLKDIFKRSGCLARIFHFWAVFPFPAARFRRCVEVTVPAAWLDPTAPTGAMSFTDPVKDSHKRAEPVIKEQNTKAFGTWRCVHVSLLNCGSLGIIIWLFWLLRKGYKGCVYMSINRLWSLRRYSQAHSFDSGRFQQHMETAPSVSPVMNWLCYRPSQLHVTKQPGKHVCSIGVSGKHHQMCFVIVHTQSSDRKVTNGPK